MAQIFGFVGSKITFFSCFEFKRAIEVLNHYSMFEMAA